MSNIYFYYFLAEIIKTFLVGVLIFLSIITMVQFLQISEFILIHNVPLGEIAQIIFFMGVSFLPTILPMSLLFSILLTYTRFSSDSEIIAFQSFGLSIAALMLPAIIFSLVIFIVSYQTLDIIGPISRKSFDDKIQIIGGQKIISSLKEKTFIEDLFNFTLYFNEKIDSHNLKDIFIQDNRDLKHPLVIIAKRGTIDIATDMSLQNFTLRLTDGTAIGHSVSASPIVKFKNYTINLSSPIKRIIERRDTNTFIISELIDLLKSNNYSTSIKYEFLTEIHRRLTVAFSCLIFGVLGATLGISTNRRSSASKGFILSIICLASYWILVAASTSLSTSSSINSPYALWIPNLVFIVLTIFTFHKAIRTG